MKQSSYFQFAVISASDPEQFESELNSKMKELSQLEPDVQTDITGGHFCALISWKESTIVCETVMDEFHNEGIRHVCGECPLHDIETDRRRKRVSCRYSEFGETRLDSECCEYFYKLLKQNKIDVITPEIIAPGMNKVRGTLR